MISNPKRNTNIRNTKIIRKILSEWSQKQIINEGRTKWDVHWLMLPRRKELHDVFFPLVCCFFTTFIFVKEFILQSNIFLERNVIFIEFFHSQKFLLKEKFLPHPHKAATHNACALVRAMASNTRMANTDDERALLTAADKKDVKTLTSLLQKGVCPNVHDGVST